MQNCVTFPGDLFVGKLGVAFLKKIAPGRQSLQLKPLLWLVCSICDQVSLPVRADDLYDVLPGAVLWVSVVLSALVLAPKSNCGSFFDGSGGC